ncbi:MAG: bifunctional folylpolyglutamate synthase/dihydrofolate synthase [Acetobacteraceae bacterium]|nr:bifunctional folylpolyglutamate synthase/dihydrofolate synthase [Acetobacteraceae bacterium]
MGAARRAYHEALEFIHGLMRFGSQPGLARIEGLLARLGQPHLGLRSVHVGGTNGKGSVVAVLDSVLREQGYSVGRYISPYLEAFPERMCVNGRPITGAEVVELLGRVRPAIEAMVAEGSEHPTEFEVVTALGFLFFRRRCVDLAVVEVGLGGRLDATNVLRPGDVLCSVVTNVGLDHVDRLGHSVEEVAREKAGIIKDGGWVVTAASHPSALGVLEEAARQKGARLVRVGRDVTFRPCGAGGFGARGGAGAGDRCGAAGVICRPRGSRVAPGPVLQRFDYRGLDWRLGGLSLPLLGPHQLFNAATALAALEVLNRQGVPVSEAAVRRGLRRVRWPGRLEVFWGAPLVVLDGAHNAEGARALAAALPGVVGRRPVVLLMGVLADKPYAAMAGALGPLARAAVVARTPTPRALEPEVLGRELRRWVSRVEVEPEPGEALQRALALAGREGAVVATGSLYLVGPVRSLLRRWRSPGGAF